MSHCFLPFPQNSCSSNNNCRKINNKLFLYNLKVSTVLHILSLREARMPSRGAPAAPTRPGLQTDRIKAPQQTFNWIWAVKSSTGIHLNIYIYMYLYIAICPAFISIVNMRILFFHKMCGYILYLTNINS